jgi:PLP dependent protein
MIAPSQQALQDIRERIAAAARSVGRDPAAVDLIAVSKTYAAADLKPVLEAGHRQFGENRVQEAQGKWPELKAQFPGIALHLIGPLQSNKAKEAVALFDTIHTVDRPKIAEALATEMVRQGKRVRLFVQVNTGEEPQKAGIMPRDAAAFFAMCRETLKLELDGLMCIPPVEDEPAVHFAFLAKLAKDNGLSSLSMGMSSDFVTAVQLGATHVRVGSAIFGSRG